MLKVLDVLLRPGVSHLQSRRRAVMISSGLSNLDCRSCNDHSGLASLYRYRVQLRKARVYDFAYAYYVKQEYTTLRIREGIGNVPTGVTLPNPSDLGPERCLTGYHSI